MTAVYFIKKANLRVIMTQPKESSPFPLLVSLAHGLQVHAELVAAPHALTHILLKKLAKGDYVSPLLTLRLLLFLSGPHRHNIFANRGISANSFLKTTVYDSAAWKCISQ